MGGGTCRSAGAGLAALARYAPLSPDRLADALLARLEVTGGARDDIALIVVRL